MLTSTSRVSGVTRVALLATVVVALLVGGVGPPPASAAAPVNGVHPSVPTPSGPAWLVTKNAMTTGPERTALIDLLVRQIERQRPGDVIRLTTWSFHSERVAAALASAFRRGVSVRVVVDQKKWHLKAVRTLRRTLGTKPSRDSYIVAPYTQSTHAKVVTFSRDRTVLISSANVSDPRQWNHSVVLQNPDLYAQTSAWVDRLGAGDGMRYTKVSTPGIVLHFYPGTVDPVLDAIRSARGEPITVQMSTWKGPRGTRLAQALVEASGRGSPVVVNTGEPWSDAVRSVDAAGIDVFDTLRATGGRAKAHDKLLIVGDDVYTGSTNWGAFPRTFSEVVAHIESAPLADQLREYVSRTRVQAGGDPVTPRLARQVFDVAPTPGGLDASWSVAGPYDVSALRSFVVTVARPSDAGRTVLTTRTVPAATNRGVAEPAATLTTRMDGLPGGVPLQVDLVPMGDRGPLGTVETRSVTPYLAAATTPTGLSVVPRSPRRAAVTIAAATRPHAPPRRGFQVTWSSDRGRTWTSRTITGTRTVVRGLPPDVLTRVKVREVPIAGAPSAFTRPVSVRPGKRPSRPENVSLRARRPTVVAARWQDPAYSGRGPVKAWVVRYRVDDGRWERERLRDRRKNVFVIRGLPRRGEVDVRIAAVNKHGSSRLTPIVTLDLGRR